MGLDAVHGLMHTGAEHDMTRIFIALLVLIFAVYGLLFVISPTQTGNSGTATTTIATSTTAAVVAEKLNIPWDIAFLPDGTLLVTERPGNLLHIDLATGFKTTISVPSASSGEGGLLGIAIHPDFARNRFLYLYHSIQKGGTTINRVVRYSFIGESLQDEFVILDTIPGALYHDGGRIEFGPDGKLYITTGDATKGALAQDTESLAGKILRLNDDGTVPSDNPLGNAVYSLGHRNPQGLAWDESGNLWETEHGPSGESGNCCHDELNRIEKGANFGWPIVIGDEKNEGFTSPSVHSGDSTWAPASLAYYQGALYFGALKGEGVYKAPIENGAVTGVTKYLDSYGRIRTIRLGPDAMFYVTTSNTDGRGSPRASDDRILRVDPALLR